MSETGGTFDKNHEDVIKIPPELLDFPSICHWKQRLAVIHKGSVTGGIAMRSQEELQRILDEVTAGLREIFGAKLENVILYGSYARGDADEQSDIDIMALINGVPREELWKYREAVHKKISLIEEEWEYDILLSVILEDVPTFQEYANYMPFFKNVIREGIGLVREAFC